MTDGITAMIKIVSFLLTRQESMPFRTPVTWREMGLHDYPLKVPRPMDLGTVKRLLEENSYRAVTEIAEDIRRVWSNCMLYNDKDSELHRTAQFLSDIFEVSHSCCVSYVARYYFFSCFWGVVMFFCSDFSSKWTIVPMTRFAPNFSFVLFKGTVFKACETTGG